MRHLNDKGYLLLQNGRLFEGRMAGARIDTAARIVFTTDLTGYNGILTDPGYQGQIVVMTFPLIGHHGWIAEECESNRPALSAFVVRELCDVSHHYQSDSTLRTYLIKQGIPCLEGVDTRAIVKEIRTNGMMNAALLNQKPDSAAAMAAELAKLEYNPSLADVTCSERHTQGEGKRHVVLLDCGVIKSVTDGLVNRKCKVTMMPACTSVDEILRLRPDGIVLSNGPGDPGRYRTIIERVRILAAEKIPILGICLGHLILALSQGASVEPMLYGHHGANLPVRDVKSGRSFITAQNHSYTVCMDQLPPKVIGRYTHVNDGSCEGLDYMNIPGLSVQFYPDVYAGSMGVPDIYTRFMDLMGECA